MKKKIDLFDPKVALPIVLTMATLIRLLPARFRYLLGVDPYFHLAYIEEALKAGKWFDFFTIAWGPGGMHIRGVQPLGFYKMPVYVHRVLGIFGVSLYDSFRVTPIIFGIATIAFFYVTVLKLYGREEALMASLFLATSFGHAFRSMANYYRGDNYALFWYGLAILGIAYAIRLRSRIGKASFALYLIPVLAGGLASIFWKAYYPVLVFLLANGVLLSVGAFLLGKDKYIIDGLAIVLSSGIGALLANYLGKDFGYGMFGYKGGVGINLAKKLSLGFGSLKDAYLIVHIKYLLPLAVVGIIALIALSYAIKDMKLRAIAISVFLAASALILFLRFPAVKDLSSGFGVVRSNPLIVETLPSGFHDLWRSYGLAVLLSPPFFIRFLPRKARPHDFMFLGLILPSLYMLKTWTRFLFLGSMAVALMGGVGLVELYRVLPKWGLKKNAAVVLLLFLIVPGINAYVGAKNTWDQRPMVNDHWEKALRWLGNSSNENDVIMAWWDRGHWVTYFSRRAPVAQGGPNGAVARYYLGKLDANWAERLGVDYVVVSYYDLMEFGSVVETANVKGNYGMVVLPLVSSGKDLVFQGSYGGLSYRVVTKKGGNWDTTIYYQGQAFPPRGIYIEYGNETIKPEVPNPISNAYVYINLNYGYAVLMNEETLNTTMMRLWIDPKPPYKLVYSDGGMVKIFRLEHPNVAVVREGENITLRFENATGTSILIEGFLDNGTRVFKKWYSVRGKKEFAIPAEVQGVVIRYAYYQNKKVLDRGLFRRDFEP